MPIFRDLRPPSAERSLDRHRLDLPCIRGTLSRSSGPGEVALVAPLPTAIHNLCSTVFAAPSQFFANLSRLSALKSWGAAFSAATNQQPRTRSVRPMSSKAAAANTGSCACIRGICFCRTGNESIWHRIPGCRADAARPARRVSPKAPRRVPNGQKKCCAGPEHREVAAVDSQAPGDAPQPLTLNHPASNPGPMCGWGSPFLDFAHRRASTYSRPSTRSSRWIIAALPPKPRIDSIAADALPLIFCASSAS